MVSGLWSTEEQAAAHCKFIVQDQEGRRVCFRRPSWVACWEEMRMGHIWKAILTDGHAESAWERIWEISREISDIRCWDEEETGLARGVAGGALFFGYLAMATGNMEALQNCRRLQAAAARSLPFRSTDTSLFGGFPGIAWVTTHLKDMFDPLAEDPANEMDESLLNCLNCPEWRQSYDLIIGLVGLGIYALERLETGRGREILGSVIRHLGQTAVIRSDGIAWFTPSWQLPEWQLQFAPKGCWVLGLAHGIPGVIALLGRAVRADVEKGMAVPLLEGCVRWLLSRRNPDGGHGLFATILPKGKEDMHSYSRIAWCYGDLGVAMALLMAAKDAARPDWEAAALSIAQNSARRPFEHSGVCDACLCHGAAGNSLLFLRLFFATGDPCFHQAATGYLDETIAFHCPGKPFGGFPTFMLDEKRVPGTHHLPGVLEGNAGVGLIPFT